VCCAGKGWHRHRIDEFHANKLLLPDPFLVGERKESRVEKEIFANKTTNADVEISRGRKSSANAGDDEKETLMPHR